MARFWMNEKASASVNPLTSISRPFARSISLRASSRSSSERTSPPSACSSVWRAGQLERGTRSLFWNGLTR